MEQYISKFALLTEIKRRIKTNKECMLGLRNLDYYQGKIDALNDTLSSLDTLDVKDVNLEKEMNEALTHLTDKDMRGWFRYFFELGVCVNNPITAADRGIVDEIIISLKQVENDYRINHTKEIEWLRNKVKKGE